MVLDLGDFDNPVYLFCQRFYHHFVNFCGKKYLGNAVAVNSVSIDSFDINFPFRQQTGNPIKNPRFVFGNDVNRI